MCPNNRCRFGVKIATESWRSGYGDFLLFIVLPEFIQKLGVYALYPAKSLLAALLFVGLYFVAKKGGKMRSPITTFATVAVIVGMCFGDVLV